MLNVLLLILIFLIRTFFFLYIFIFAYYFHMSCRHVLYTIFFIYYQFVEICFFLPKLGHFFYLSIDSLFQTYGEKWLILVIHGVNESNWYWVIQLDSYIYKSSNLGWNVWKAHNLLQCWSFYYWVLVKKECKWFFSSMENPEHTSLLIKLPSISFFHNQC